MSSNNNDNIEVGGVVIEALPGGDFLVEITDEGFNGHRVRCFMSGKMRMYCIKIVPGDSVQLTMTKDNLEVGRITYRKK
jgi:translation initiation factor IF-1